MMSSTTAAARSLVPLSLPKNIRRSGRTNGALPPGDAPTWQRGSTKGRYQRISGKAPKAKNGKHRRQNNDRPKHDVLLHRLSLPSSSTTGTLLERIGESVRVEAASTLSDSDGIVDEDRVSEDADIITDLPFSTTPHVYTPEPGEVERFLQSVIGAPPPPPPSSPPGPAHACLGNEPSVALETLNFPVQDPSSPVLYSPAQSTVNSPSSANLTLDQNSFPGDTMAPPSPSTIEQCRKHLVPVLLASAQARNPGKRLDSEQCLRLLSDDRCRNLFRQAKEMKLQLSSPASRQAPACQGRSESPKRDGVDARVRSSRSRIDSANTVVSRRDSEITVVDFAGERLPPKAPRAMLRASRAPLNKPSTGARDEAPYEALVASRTAEDHPPSATPLAELVHQAVEVFPTLMPTSQAETGMDAPVVTWTGDQPMLDQAVSPGHAQTSTDFVSHLPTQPGIWFRQQGRRYAEIVDVDIDVSDDMFYVSTERRPFRLRMHLRLCSVPVGGVAENEGEDALPQDVDRHVLHWPQKGKLVVQVNPESERSTTWLPYTLESDPLDVTGCVRPGKNTFRFIQLSDLSEFTFVLAASPPPPEEDAWRSLDWASLVEGPRARSSPSVADDPMHGLSEFARLPVTVRS